MDRLYCLVSTAARTWVKLMVTMAWLLLLRSCMYVRAVVLQKQTHFYTWFCIALCFLYVTINRDGDIILWFCPRQLYLQSLPLSSRSWISELSLTQWEDKSTKWNFCCRACIYRLKLQIDHWLLQRVNKKSKFCSFKKGEYI